MDNNQKLPQLPQDPEAVIKQQQLQAKRDRHIALGVLMDKAAEVLSDVLDSNDPLKANQRMRAAELAANLYIQQENGERQDAALELQQRRLKLEEAKLAAGSVFNQQNNIYIDNRTAAQNPGQLTQQQQDELLARKRAQDALLAMYLPTPPQQQEEKSSENVIDVPAEDVPINDGDNTTVK